MSRKDRIKTQLQVARQLTESMLADIKTPQQWTHQVAPQANHPLWVVGHLASGDNYIAGMLAPAKSMDLPGWKEKFGMGSQPVSDPAAYPPPAEMLERLRERRQTVLAELDRTERRRPRKAQAARRTELPD